MAGNDILILEGPDRAGTEPSELMHENVSVESVIELLKQTESFWGETNSDGAVLRWCFKRMLETPIYGKTIAISPNSDRPSLQILFNSEAGYHFRFDFDQSEKIGFDPAIQPSKRVTHYLCGEEAYFPSATFVSFEKAQCVVRSFIENEGKSNELKWIEAKYYRFDRHDAWEALEARSLAPDKTRHLAWFTIVPPHEFRKRVGGNYVLPSLREFHLDNHWVAMDQVFRALGEPICDAFRGDHSLLEPFENDWDTFETYSSPELVKRIDSALANIDEKEIIAGLKAAGWIRRKPQAKPFLEILRCTSRAYKMAAEADAYLRCFIS